jgi:sugar phosphate isomerase/epimerase
MSISSALSRRRFIGQAGIILGGGLAAAGLTMSAPAAPGQVGDRANPTLSQVRLDKPDVEVAIQSAYQIGCYTRPFDKFDWRVAYDAIAGAGYKYAGLISTNTKEWIMIRPNTALEEARQMGLEAVRRGLQLVSIYGDFSVAQSVQDGVAGLQRLIDNCAAASCPNLLLGGVTDEKLYEAYFKAIAESADYAASKKVGLSIKPHGGQNATGSQCRAAIERVGGRKLGLWYDPGNIFYYSNGELDPVADAATVGGLVVGMSVKDYRHPKDVLVTPGTGKVNFPAVFSALQRGGFTRGPMLVECLAPGDLAKVTADARQTRLMLEELTGQKA